MRAELAEPAWQTWVKSTWSSASKNQRRLFGSAIYIVLSISGAALSTYTVQPSAFSPWYPPAGLAFAYLAMVGVRGAPVVFSTRILGLAVAYPETLQSELAWAVLEAVLITACYAAGAGAFRRYRLERFEEREFGLFTMIAVVLTPLSATACVLLLQHVKYDIGWSQAQGIITSFWVGDAVAVAAIVPFALALQHRLDGSDPSEAAVPRWSAFFRSAALISCPIVAVSMGGKHAVLLLAAGVLPTVWMATQREALTTTAGLCALNFLVALSVSLSPLSHATITDVQAMMLASSLIGLHIVASSRTHSRSRLEALERQQRGAEVNRAQSLAQLAISIAQDLRNYMTVVIGNAQLLPSDPDVKPYSQQIADAGRSASQLAVRLADFSKHRSAKLELSNIAVLLQTLRPTLDALALDSVRMRYRIDADASCLVDPIEFDQMIINLVNNAIDACDVDGEVTVDLSEITLVDGDMSSRRAPGRYATVCVSDNGAGLDDEQLSRVFDGLSSAKDGGVAIGLATVRTSVTALNGFVDVRSTEGRGTAFTLLIPVSDLDCQRDRSIVDQ